MLPIRYSSLEYRVVIVLRLSRGHLSARSGGFSVSIQDY